MKNNNKNNNMILGLAFGFGSEILKPFLYSLARTGFNGELCLLVSNSDENHSLSLFEKEKENENSSNYRLNIIPFNFKDMDWSIYRYILYRDYLVKYVENKMNENEFNIMLTDTRDVVFQKDPFDFDINNSLCCFLEDKSKSINSCPYNSGWINDIFGHNGLNEIGSNMISCAGVTIGDYKSIIIYLETMIDYINKMGKKNCVDQGIHNYIIYHRENILRNKVNLKLYETGKGPVFTMGHVSEKDIIFNDKGFVINDDGSIANVLHQYDRHSIIYEKADVFQKLK